jgi:hypothetical protein
MQPDEMARIINDGYGAAVFGPDLLQHYIKAQPTLGVPGSGRSFFLTAAEDVLRMTDAASAARQTGMSPSTSLAYSASKASAGDPFADVTLEPPGAQVYAILFPRDGMPLKLPTPEDAGLTPTTPAWPHFLQETDPVTSWGHTAVAGDGFYLRNPTRELVTPAGWAIDPGSVLVRIDRDGWQVVRRYP